jgi:hypothetical protein
MTEYAATNTVPKSTAPMSHNTTNTTGTGSSRNLAYALAMGLADLRARARCSAPGPPVRRGWPLLLRVVDSRRCRIHLLRGWVNKDHHALLSLLVNDEHALAIPVRRSLDTGLGVQISGPTLFEVLVGFGKLAGVNALRALGSTMTPIERFLVFEATNQTIEFSKLLDDRPGSDK